MNRFLAISAVALFSFVVAGTAMAQERAVLQEGSSGLGGGSIGSGPGGGIDNSWMRELLSHPETVYGRSGVRILPAARSMSRPAAVLSSRSS
jgi:hypothetical protein